MEIERKVVESLYERNTPPLNDNLDMDFRFALAVFLSLVPSDDILANNIDPTAMDFVLGRLALLQNSRQNYCKYLLDIGRNQYY